MKRGYWKKLSTIVVGIILVSVLMVSQAIAWGSATHAYIDDHLGRKGPVRNLNEIYGGMAPDVFNYLFSNVEWLNYLYNETHYANFLSVWEKADTLFDKSVAFGFVSHNGITGADATAHSNYDYGLNQEPFGWVIAKAVEMASIDAVQYVLKVYKLSDIDENGNLCGKILPPLGPILIRKTRILDL